MNKEIHDFLDNFSSLEQNYFSRQKSNISKKITGIVEESDDEITEEAKAEIWAFDFRSNLAQDNNWGTYHTFMLSTGDEHLGITEYPSINHITEETIKYWYSRTSEVSNVFLSTMYSDLVIDFAPKVAPDFKIEIKLRRNLIDDYIYTAEKQLDCWYENIKIIKRALYLAIKISDKKRIEKK